MPVSDLVFFQFLPFSESFFPARRAGDYNGALNRQLKILGVEIDDSLKITRHILAKCKRASSDIFALTKIKIDLKLSAADSGLLFRSVVLSRLFYACEFWWPLLLKKDKVILHRVIRRARKNNLISMDFDLEAFVNCRQLRLFHRFKTETYFNAFFPQIAYSGRRYIAPRVVRERERKFFFTYMAFYCINKGIIV